MASEDTVWSEVAQKQDQEDQKLKKNDAMLDVIEADLSSMEVQMEKAEARYQQARQQLARKLEERKEKPEGKQSPHIQPSEDHPIDEAEALPPEDHKHPHHKHLQREPKNAGALPDKVVSRQRWVAARNTEKRARESAKRAREILRNRQRDRKMEAGYVSQEAEASAAPDEPAPAPPAPADVASPETVSHGAQDLAARLKSVHSRETSAADKRLALLKVVTCGRENYYTFKPEDVFADLKQRGLIDDSLAAEFTTLIKDETLKPTSHQIPFAEWLDRAKKVSHVERLDDAPFKADEAAYLGHLDGRQLALAEAELEAAEAQLEIAMKAAQDASTRYEQAVAASGIDHATLEETEQADFDLSVNEAERFDAEHSHDKFESHGSKNAGALPDKVVSRDRWLAARSTEERAREAQKKARDVGRINARDAKLEAAEVSVPAA